MSTLKHIYLNAPLTAGKTTDLPKEVAHRLTRVLRYKAGDKLAVFNGQDGLFAAELAANNTLILQQQLAAQPAANPTSLYICLPKKETFSRVLRQATELNVAHIYPLFSQYTVPDKLNTARCQAILIEAAEQCERLTLPTLHAPQQLTKITFLHPTLWAAERPAMWKENNKEQSAQTFTATLIGPEGGFSPAEVTHLATQQNLHPTSLGETILRTDTAVVAAIALLNKNP